MSLVKLKKWIRSTFCESDACVEATTEGGYVALRPSDLPALEVRFTRQEWAAFVKGVKSGQFDF